VTFNNKIWYWSVEGFSVGGPSKNGFSHYFLTSPVQHCLALTRCHVIRCLHVVDSVVSTVLELRAVDKLVTVSCRVERCLPVHALNVPVDLAWSVLL
jgi:hypothetical protein